MNKSPLISFVIPAYNAENFISELIDSIERQTCDYEAIFVDDGSKDNTLSIINGYAGRNPRFKVIHQENAGANRARARGVSEAKGTWITFLDADDLITADLSDICKSLCASCRNDVIVTTTDITPPPTADYRLDTHDYTRAIISQKIHTGPWAKLFSRHLFDEETFNMPKEIVSAEDYIMNIRLALKATNGALITPGHFYDIRRDVNPNSAMKTFKGSAEYGKLYAGCLKDSFTEEQWNEYLPEITQRAFTNWHQENRKRWRIPKEVLESEGYHELSENIKKTSLKLKGLERLNWELRNPILRFILDMATRSDGLYRRYIKSN